ncbi:MAG: exopolyphosphatase [Burkholderiaceae bacterium]
MSNDQQPKQKFRLVTRSDFDGLVCAVLLKELDLVDDILFVHPKDMQDGKVEITARDITTNLPYVPSAHIAFDHHLSESSRTGGAGLNHIIDPNAPSAARVVYDYYGGRMRFENVSAAMMDAVDKADSAQFSHEEILHPTDWVLLNYLMDARTGLGRFRDFTISNYQLMMKLIDACREMSIQQILQMPDVVERVELYREHEQLAAAQIKKCATQTDNVVVLDLRKEETIFATNRFMIYALFPTSNVSIHVMWGLRQQNTVFAVGKSILDRSSKKNVGEICLKYGGGGHMAAGTCQVDNAMAVQVQAELVSLLKDSADDAAPSQTTENEASL